MVQVCTTQELKKLLSDHPDLFLVDCRTQEEFDAGHIPQARHIPLGSDLSQFDWPNEKPIYVICHSGGRSLIFCHELDRMGKNPMNVEGGMREWNG